MSLANIVLEMEVSPPCLHADGVYQLQTPCIRGLISGIPQQILMEVTNCFFSLETSMGTGKGKVRPPQEDIL